MSRIRQGNDRAGGPAPRRGPAPRAEGAGQWLWGWHAVTAALANPERTHRRLLATAARAAEIAGLGLAGPRPQIAETRDIAAALPPGAAHQGVALLADPLADAALDDIATPARGVILMLDQVTDPQNVGAILRSAAAFGARGLVLQDRHAPPLAGAAAKAAAGAVERMPVARVTNLSRALERLADLGWRAVGLDGGASASLAEALDGSPTVLVLGSEGEGLRRLVAEHCETTAHIGMPGGFESLNVSAAAAVALYEATRPRG